MHACTYDDAFPGECIHRGTVAFMVAHLVLKVGNVKRTAPEFMTDSYVAVLHA